MRGLILAVTGLGLAACTAPEVVSKPAGTPWQFETHASALRAASCPDGVAFERAISLPISVTEIDRGTPDQQARALNGMSFAGAWHLTAGNPNFGGLSGLAVMPSGSLLAINDAGVWVWIGIDPETGAPDGIGSIANMRAADGNFFARKQAGDSEGLTFRDGLALVSFEQQHRIEAFDLEGCGTAARAARVVDLPSVILGMRLPNNRGAEALSLFGDGALQVGFEVRNMEGSPAGRVVGHKALTDVSRLYQPDSYLLTDMDYHGEMMAHVFRAYDPIRGARVRVRVSPVGGGNEVAFADLKPPLPVDNFEGIAFGRSPSGVRRIWLISDDNFNPDKQRTLLFAFDLD